MRDPTFARPDLLAGRYLLGDLIGRGGMGVVRRAWDTRLERYVAVKLLRNVALDAESRTRFGAEVKILARLNHPGLITLYDAATPGDEPYLVMELVEGDPLNLRCHRIALEIGEVASIGARLADALAYVHQRQLVHRDVKPSNVLLADDGRVKLADFGIARLVDGTTGHTPTGIMMGTAAYLSPEQVRDEPVGVSSDIYSLGLVLIEMLTGIPVFAGPPGVVTVTRLTMSPRLDESFPAPLRRLLEEMTHLHPQDRPTADQVAAGLRELLGRLPPPPLTATVRTPAPTALLAGVPAQTGPIRPPETAPIPTVPAGPGPRQSRLPIRRLALGVGMVTVVVAALLLGPFKGHPEAGAAQVSRPAGTPKPQPSATVSSDPVKAAKKQVRDTLTKTQNSLKKKAQNEVEKVADDLTTTAQNALAEAAAKAQHELDKAGKKTAWWIP